MGASGALQQEDTTNKEVPGAVSYKQNFEVEQNCFAL